jgi:hypothetical protein
MSVAVSVNPALVPAEAKSHFWPLTPHPSTNLTSISGLSGEKNQKAPPCATPSEDSVTARPLPETPPP